MDDNSEFSIDELLQSGNGTLSSTSSSNKSDELSGGDDNNVQSDHTNETKVLHYGNHHTSSTTDIINNLSRHFQENAGENGCRYLLGMLIQRLTRGVESIQEAVSNGALPIILQSMQYHKGDSIVVRLGLICLGKQTTVKDGAKLIGNVDSLRLVKEIVLPLLSSRKIAMEVIDIVKNVFENNKNDRMMIMGAADNGASDDNDLYYATMFDVLLCIYEKSNGIVSTVTSVLTQMKIILDAYINHQIIADHLQCLLRFSSLLNSITIDTNVFNDSLSILKLLINAEPGLQNRALDILRKAQAHFSLEDETALISSIKSLTTLTKIPEVRDCIVVGDGMIFAVLILPRYSIAITLIKHLSTNDNGMKALASAVFAPRRLRSTINYEIAIIVLNHLATLNVEAIQTFLPVTVDSAIQAVQSLLERAHDENNVSLRTAGLAALAQLPKDLQFPRESLSDLQVTKSAMVSLEISMERKERVGACNAIQLINSLSRSPEMLFDFECEKISGSLIKCLNQFGSSIENGVATDRTALSIITGDLKILEVPEIEYQNKLLKTKQLLRSIVDHHNWVAKLEDNINIMVRNANVAAEASALFAMLQSSALPMVEYMINHNVNVNEARASGGALKLILSIDKAATDLVERSHERESVKNDNLAKTRAALAEEKNKSATAKHALLQAKSRIEALSVQTESLLRKTAEREKGWENRIEVLKQNHQDYISGMEAKHAFELAEAAQEVASFAKSSNSTKSFHAKISSKIRNDVEKTWKKKMRDLTHKHLIAIEELKEQHEAALKNKLFDNNKVTANAIKNSNLVNDHTEWKLKLDRANEYILKLQEEIEVLKVDKERLIYEVESNTNNKNKKDIDPKPHSSSTSGVGGKNESDWNWSGDEKLQGFESGGISRIETIHQKLKLAEDENAKLLNQIKLLNGGTTTTMANDNDEYKLKYQNLSQLYKNILNDHHNLQEDVEKLVERKVEMAVGEYKKAMIEVVQNQASTANRDKKTVIKSAIDRERRKFTVKMEEMRSAVAREVFDKMKDDATIEAREGLFQVLEDEIATEKTDGIIKMMRGIHLSTNHHIDEENNLREEAIEKAITEARQEMINHKKGEHEIMLLEKRAQMETRMNIETKKYEDELLALRKELEIEVAKARGDNTELEIKLRAAENKIEMLQEEEFSIEAWKIEEKRTIKSQVMVELETEHNNLMQLAMEEIIRDLEREKQDAVTQTRIETERKMREEYREDLAKEMEGQKALHDLALQALERKLLTYDSHKVKHEEMVQQFDEEVKTLKNYQNEKDEQIKMLENDNKQLENEKSGLSKLLSENQAHVQKLEDQIRDTLAKVFEARQEGEAKIQECDDLRKSQIEQQNLLAKTERDLSRSRVSVTTLKAENAVLKEQLLEMNESCKENETLCEELRREKNALLDQQTLNAPKLRAYTELRKNNEETNAKLVETAKKLNLVTGEFKLLKNSLSMEKDDTSYLRKELVKMEDALRTSTDMLNTAAHKKVDADEIHQIIKDAYNQKEHTALFNEVQDRQTPKHIQRKAQQYPPSSTRKRLHGNFQNNAKHAESKAKISNEQSDEHSDSVFKLQLLSNSSESDNGKTSASPFIQPTSPISYQNTSLLRMDNDGLEEFSVDSDADSEFDFIKQATSTFVNDSNKFVQSNDDSSETNNSNALETSDRKAKARKKNSLVQKRIKQFTRPANDSNKEFFVRLEDDEPELAEPSMAIVTAPNSSVATSIEDTHSTNKSSRVIGKSYQEHARINESDLNEFSQREDVPLDKSPSKTSISVATTNPKKENIDTKIQNRDHFIKKEEMVIQKIDRSIQKQELANRIAAMSNKFSEIERIVKPVEDVGDRSEYGVLDSPTERRIIEEQVAQYEDELKNGTLSPKNQATMPSTQKERSLKDSPRMSHQQPISSPMPPGMRNSTTRVVKGLVERLESMATMSPIVTAARDPILEHDDEIQNMLSSNIDRNMKKTSNNENVFNPQPVEWKRSFYKRDTALPFSSLLSTTSPKHGTGVREVPDNVIDRSSPLNEVDSAYLIQEIHRFIQHSKDKISGNDDKNTTKDPKDEKRKKQKKKSKKAKKDKKKKKKKKHHHETPEDNKKGAPRHKNQISRVMRQQYRNTLRNSTTIKEEQKTYMAENLGSWY